MELQGGITAEERKIARNWYFWLWFSPLVAFPTSTVLFLYLIYAGDYFPFSILSKLNQVAGHYLPLLSLITISPALLHLILLIPALDKKRPFVRWHARQAMLIVAVRTCFIFITVEAFIESDWTIVFLFLSLAIWFFGTLWGQLEANRGKCTLMKWFEGRAMRTSKPAMKAFGLPEEADIQTWIETIRFSPDPQARAQALQALEQLGLTEQL